MNLERETIMKRLSVPLFGSVLAGTVLLAGPPARLPAQAPAAVRQVPNGSYLRWWASM
jgi:hypothetical protein